MEVKKHVGNVDSTVPAIRPNAECRSATVSIKSNKSLLTDSNLTFPSSTNIEIRSQDKKQNPFA